MVVRGIAIVAMWMLCEALANADCGGVQRATPVRNLVATRPVLTTLQKIRANAVSRRASCSGTQAVQASCSGAQAVGCAGSMVVPQAPAPMPPAAKLISAPVQDWIPIQESPIQYEIFQPPTRPVCVDGRCDMVNATPIRDAVSNAYQQALASAQYRAANRIKGHSYLDTHRTSGVGYASHDSNPTTCLGRGGSNYAVVQGTDGWYATKFNK